MDTELERKRVVDPSLQQDYDHFSEHDPQERHAEWKRRRETCPVSYSSAHGGFAYLTTFADVSAALSDTMTYSSAEGVGVPPQPMKLYPEDMDPPESRKYRQLINPPLAPQVVATYEAWIREYTIELLDAIGDKTEFDVVEEFARPLPQVVTMRLLGMPMERLELVSRTTTLLATSPRGDAAADAAGAELFEYLYAYVAEKTASEDAGDDMIATLVRAEVDGERIPTDVVISMVALLLFGGLHTTTGAIAGVLVWLADHPEGLARVRDEPDLIAASLDEFIRWTSPSSHLGRTATADVEIRGCPVHAGERVMLGIGSANFDPDKFEDPEELVLGRKATHHLGFGLGPHRCAGSHLAKLQLRVALEEFVRRYAAIEVTDRAALHYSGGEVRSLDRTPVRVRPALETSA